MDPEIVFGERDHARTDRVGMLKSVFDAAGIKSRISSDIQADLWKKFIAICVSGLLAVTKTTYGELRELTETRVLMLELLNEIYQLSQKIGIKIDADYINRFISLRLNLLVNPGCLGRKAI
jgi:2-dehydropantoate 2-reductase